MTRKHLKKMYPKLNPFGCRSFLLSFRRKKKKMEAMK